MVGIYLLARVPLDETKLLVMEDIWKRYPGVVALSGVTIDLRKGEILGIVGENGAGKSTLLKILFGVIQPDRGRIYWKGREVKIRSPQHAAALGISYVPQETLLSPNLTVAEAMFLGLNIRRLWSILDPRALREKAEEILRALGVTLNPDEKVGRLSVALKQIVLIARSLATKAELIVFDEPTSALGVEETERLLDIMMRLRDSGVSIIFVSHRLEEVLKVANRVVVLRDGKKVAEFEDLSKVTVNDIVKAMIAREIKEFYPKEPVEFGSPVIEVRGLTGARIKEIDFEVREGEILGIFGLVGSGANEVGELLSGIRGAKGGVVKIRGRNISIRSPSDAIKAGIIYVPEDRRALGLIMSMNIAHNITLPTIDVIKRADLGLISPIDIRKEQDLVRRFIETLRITPRDPSRKVFQLSGGNQQKVLVARVFAANADVVIFSEPTRGIDVGAKVEIRKLMVELAKRGKAVILISSDLHEILGMSDTILVISEGKAVARFTRSEAKPEIVMEFAVRRAR